MNKFIKKFSKSGLKDIGEIGGKNASMAEMYTQLASKGILVPNGFAITVTAFRSYLFYHRLDEPLAKLMGELNRKDFSNLEQISIKARQFILQGEIPDDLRLTITDSYDNLFPIPDQPVAVRSSATAEDLPEASFAGQHESYLNIHGHEALIDAVKKCFASLYTARAIKYREDKKFDHAKVFLSVGIQQMVRSDIGCSGVGFTLEPESGFRDVVHLAGVWGLGENIVQGTVTPDEFLIFKPSLKKNLKAIIQKNMGSKTKTMVYAGPDQKDHFTVNKDTPWELREKFVLSEGEIEKLSRWALVIEAHFQHPMDFEWAKDGLTNQLYIIQARPETVHSQNPMLNVRSFHMKDKGKVITRGEAVGSMIATGIARILDSPAEAGRLRPGDILVTNTTNPDWDPILKQVAGIVTNKGGRTSHAAIIAREMGTVAIVGTENATNVIHDGDEITISCAEGKTGNVYRGKLSWKETDTLIEHIKLPEHPKAQLIIGEPDKAFYLSFLPNDGVGLMRLEFIINNYVRIHPMALAHFDDIKDEVDGLKIQHITHYFPDKEKYFIEKLSQGVATVAAAFYPKEVIVRMSDFKSNEYAGLIGGNFFEPHEQNPMIGFRGASRYYHPRYRDGFRLECEAMKVVRDEMGLTNVKLMIPFCRTVSEGEKVLALMAEYGLIRGKNGLQVYVMAEIPSNVLLAEEFAKIFDGFSIGSNDLTQLALGIDRDSALIADLFDEQNAASKQLIVTMIEKANMLHKKVGLCGQAPSDSAAFTKLIVEAGIDSISFNADALIMGIKHIHQATEQGQAVHT